jgi:rhodanese-related sulfurtransferase
MQKTITLVIVALSVFVLAQCNSQPKKAETMETNITTKAGLKQIIVDVRTPEEWNEDGHANCSVNYPLDSFEDKIDELMQYDKVILVCRSGNRAGVAKNQLISAGYTKEVENKGPWQNLTCQ